MEDYGKLILRVGLGAMMLTHGIPKLMKLFSGGVIQFPDPLGVGATTSLVLTVFAEALCALLVVIGYKTKWAVIPLIIAMLVAGFMVHGEDPWSVKEHALIYAVGFLGIGMLGAGRYSIDNRIKP